MAMPRREIAPDPSNLRPERVQLCAALAELPGWALVDGGLALERHWPQEVPAVAVGVTVSLQTFVDEAGSLRGARLTVSPHREAHGGFVPLVRSLEQITDQLVART